MCAAEALNSVVLLIDVFKSTKRASGGCLVIRDAHTNARVLRVPFEP